ncbi:MAG: hypothetical protein M1825_001003 [Sarcosagium campestre]|nr:MAG: hypothetical protein M1825_001003 [Sarcosagium campestre]
MDIKQQDVAEEPYDLVCVGFGPASLAIAVALSDRGFSARVLFLERQQSFAWHSGMLLPGARMQISFIKDLATLRDPRSHFTFINYLHCKGRLLAFTNLSTFLPLREEYNDYFAWCASHFDHCVNYGQDVVSVSPIHELGGAAIRVASWDIVARDVISQDIRSVRSRNVVIAVGGKPRIPAAFPQDLINSKIVHSSKYSTLVPSILSETNGKYRVAVVGGGQSAAEIYDDLMTRFPQSHVNLFIAASALRPSDDSPFVNEVFDPSRVDGFYALSDATKKKAISEDRVTNYGVVRSELLERLYERLYHQRLHSTDESHWQHQISTLREVVGIERDNETDKVRLLLKHSRNGTKETTQEAFDLVIVSTGYQRNVHEDLLQPTRELLPSEQHGFSIERDYRVRYRQGALAAGCGIWLQGCCEDSHGLSDTLLSILGVRGGEIVDSIFPPSETTNHKLRPLNHARFRTSPKL